MFGVMIYRRRRKAKLLLLLVTFITLILVILSNLSIQYHRNVGESEDHLSVYCNVLHSQHKKQPENSQNTSQHIGKVHDQYITKVRAEKGENQNNKKEEEKKAQSTRMLPTEENYPSVKEQFVGKGQVNLHIWSEICAHDINSLKLHPRFPFAPEKRTFITRLETSWKVWSYGQRIFGYIHPPSTGDYYLILVSTGSSQLWIDRSGHRKQGDLEIVAATNWNESLGESAIIFLKKGFPCYFEILHAALQNQRKSAVHYDKLQIRWLTPGKHKLEVIGQEHISLALNDSDVHEFIAFHDRRTPFSNACSVPKILFPPMLNYTRYPYTRLTRWLNHEELSDVFTPCNYTWGIIRPGHIPIKRYEGVKQAVMMWIYPAYNTNILNSVRFFSYKQIEEIVAEYMSGLVGKFGSKYSLQEIVRVESRKEYQNGRGVRYLIELELAVQDQEQNVFLSEYVYSRTPSQPLCYPGSDHQWSDTVPIYFIITSKQQGFWLKYLIKNMEEIYRKTRDANIYWIFYDFNSTDIDLEGELYNSSLPRRWKVIIDGGKWYKTFALNAAVNSVSDPHSIIFTLDLHINFPSTILNDIRKHCIEHFTVYTPMIMRLRCGSHHYTPHHNAFWENHGYGLIGIYKSDWDLIGGMDEVNYKYNWGGEDVDIIDRIVSAGLQFEHLPVADTYHYFHKRGGMWTDKTSKQFT